MASAEESPPESQYDQEEKKECREKLIRDAVKALTTERDTSACVPRDYVRKAWQQLRETKETSAFSEQEVAEIEGEIADWERLHSKVRTRKPSDLCVCYLAGDNPLNDLNVFLENGVHPQNMWAIEKDSKILEKARKNMNQSQQKTPNVFKGNFLDFLREFQDPFDIIYFDACGSLPSEKQETLKAIGYVFLYKKLTSPGALITTFSFPPMQTEASSSTASQEREHLIKLVTQYLKYRLVNTSLAHKIPHYNDEFLSKRTDEENYSQYIVYQIIDTAYMYIPAHRMVLSKRNSLLEQSFVKKGDLKEAIKELSPQVMEEGEESQLSIDELKKLESLIQDKEKKLKLKRTNIQETKQCIIKYWSDLLFLIDRFAPNLFNQTAEREIHQNIQQQFSLHSQLEQYRVEEKSLSCELDQLKQKKDGNIRELSAHEAQPQRILGQQGHNIKSSSTSISERWASEVFPDWKSGVLKKWEIFQLLMVHLLTNWIALIDKCSNRDLKDCLGLITESLGADGDMKDSIFSQLFDEPNEEVTTQMISTLLYGKMACPSFPVLEKLEGLQYTARKRQMFSNLFIFDRCRYVYDQFPCVLNATTVAKPHKQMVFRLAVDGLRKHLRHICEEDVFKGCNVVEEGVYKKVPVIPETSEITQQSNVEDLTSQDDVHGGEDDDQIYEFVLDSL